MVCAVLAAALWAQQGPIPGEVKTRLGALLPKGGSAVRFYSQDLYRYMDGGADIYLKYGLVAMAHREYKRAGVDATVDVFDMGGPLPAFGMYSAERSPEYRFVDIGAEGYSSESTLNFVQGRYYVRLSAFGEGAATALDDLARAISRSIGGERSLPGLLDMLPRENRVARSEKYVVEAPAGHDFLAPALTASYRFDGKATTLVVSLAADEREASRRVERLRQYYAQPGGDAIFFARGRVVVLCLHPPAGAEAFLDRVKP